MAAVNIDGNCGFIDKSGKLVIPAMYEGNFCVGMGTTIIYSNVPKFKDGLCRVIKDDKYGYIDKNGNVVIPFEYDSAGDAISGTFNEGMISAYKCNEETWEKGWGFIDITGKEIIPFIYDRVYDFDNGLALVLKGDHIYGKYGLIDKKGNEIVPCECDNIWHLNQNSGDGLYSVNKDGKNGIIDKTGKEVVPFVYDSISSFTDDLITVMIGDWGSGKWGLIDTTGNVVLPSEYDWIGSCSEGLATVKKDGKWSILEFYTDKLSEGDNPENAEAIYRLYRAGIMQGFDAERRCNPEANIKRSEVAAILIRMMDNSKRVRFSIEVAESQNLKWIDAYKQFIYTEYANEPMCLYDVDDNGIPELFIGKWWVNVYTYRNGDIVEIGYLKGDLYKLPGYKGVYTYATLGIGAEGSIYFYFEIVDGELEYIDVKGEIVFNYMVNWEQAENDCFFNDKKIPEEKYFNLLGEYFTENNAIEYYEDIDAMFSDYLLAAK